MNINNLKSQAILESLLLLAFASVASSQMRRGTAASVARTDQELLTLPE
jgi:hypothetical protein